MGVNVWWVCLCEAGSGSGMCEAVRRWMCM